MLVSVGGGSSDLVGSPMVVDTIQVGVNPGPFFHECYPWIIVYGLFVFTPFRKAIVANDCCGISTRYGEWKWEHFSSFPAV